MTNKTIPSFQDVLQAQRRIRPYLARTPLHSYFALNELVGTEVYVKDDWTPVKIGV
jgi:threonine dehydratase